MRTTVRQWRRLSAAAACGALAITLAACSSGADAPAAQADAPAKASAQGAKVSMITARSWNSFYFTVTCDVEKDAKAAGLDLKVVDFPQASYTPQGMASVVLQNAAQKPDAIINTSPDVKAMDNTLKQVTQQGVKLVNFDGIVTDDAITNGQVTTDVVETGKVGADALGKAINGTGKVLVIDLVPGLPSTNKRVEGFTAEMKAKYPNVEILPVQYDHLNTSEDAQIMASTLATHPDLAGVYFTYNQAAIGAMPSLISAGKQGVVKVVSNDSDPILVGWLKQGYIDTLTPHNVPAFAKAVVDTTVGAIEGKDANPRTVQIPPVVITKDNVDSPEVAGSLYRATC